MSVRNAILGLLAQQPRHGYELHRTFEALVGGRDIWNVKPAQVYTTLLRLEEAGLISQTATRRVGGPDQHIYELTPSGRIELDRWYLEGTHSSHQRDEVFLKIVLAVADDSANPQSVVREQRATLYRDLHELTTKRNSIEQAQGLAQTMLLDKAIMHIEADLRWLEMAEARLHEIALHPMPDIPEQRRGRPRSTAQKDDRR